MVCAGSATGSWIQFLGRDVLRLDLDFETARGVPAGKGLEEIMVADAEPRVDSFARAGAPRAGCA
jgi:hypothetical protein